MPKPRFLDHPYLLAGRRVDPVTGTLSYQGEQKHLRRKELEVLALLAEAGGDQISRTTFIEQLWQGNRLIGEQGLTVAISSLRRALWDTDRENPLILTIPRRGYQLRASVRLLARDGGLAFMAGSVVDARPDWRLKQLLERNDAHESWLAEDGRSRRIFRFCRSEQQLRKLRREIVLMRYLREALASQENVSTILDWQLEEPPYFLELAAPACGNLRGVMLGKSVPELAGRWCLLLEVAEALAAVHDAGVVHRNLSPDSVLVDRRGSERVALLGEFGLAALDDRQRLAELGIDAAGLSLKTGLLGPATAYTAPECVVGAPATAASDVYALGVLISQTVRGDFERLEASGFDEFPDGIAALLQGALATEPAARPTAAEMVAALQELARPKPAPRIAEQPTITPPPVVASAPAPATAPLVVESAVPDDSFSDVTPPPATAPSAESAVPDASFSEAVTPRPASASLVHQRIGPYRILGELARGGMGVVYIAEQLEHVQRRVALKLIRAGLDSEQVLARFEAERQALAMMSHPNISAIFDAGTTDDGHPYFVMEFVPGKDIVHHCDHAKLNLRDRIRLFLQVCDGVLHAHQKGLIHRDLKPGNILVKPKSEQAAQVKLIDFGVAKSLTSRLAAGPHTQIGVFVGTPVYSSPEQVTDPTRDIDTRADLYSLGVVLYELLAGVTPRSAEDLSADTPSELARRLRDAKTPPMGSRYSSLGTTEQQKIAELRALSTDGLSLLLCSDLDWIVGKCIAQDPDDRYATVQDLRQDLQRWLDDRPVEARPANAWYRFRKMVRRNRLNTAIVVGAVLGLLVSTATAVSGFLQAKAALEESVAAVDFQIRKMNSISPRGMGIDLREAFEQQIQGAAGLTKSEREQAQRVLNSINTTDLAINQLIDHIVTPSLTAIRSEFSGRTELKLKLLRNQAEILKSLDRNDVALSVATELVEASSAEMGEFHEQTIRAMIFKGEVLSGLARAADAKTTLRTALRLSDENFGASHSLTGKAKGALCDLYSNGTDDPPMATQVCESAIATLTSELGPLHRDTVLATLSLATLHINFGKLEDAKTLLARLNSSNQRDLELEAKSLSMNGAILFLKGNGKDAVTYMSKALESARLRFGMNHSTTLGAETSLGVIYTYLSEFEKARPLLTRSFEVNEKSLGLGHETTISQAHGLAALLLNIGQPAEALQLLDRISLDSISTESNRLQLVNHVRLLRAQLELRLGNGDQAVLEMQKIVDQRTKTLGKDDPSTLFSRAGLAYAMEISGKVSEAMQSYSALLTDVETVESKGVDLPRIFFIKGVLGRYLRLRGDLAESEKLLRDTIGERFADEKIKTTGTRNDFLFAMGELCESVLMKEGRPAADSLCLEALNFSRAIKHPNDNSIVKELERAGRAHLAAGNLKEAEAILNEAWTRIEEDKPLAKLHGASVSKSLLDLYSRRNSENPTRSNALEVQKWQQLNQEQSSL